MAIRIFAGDAEAVAQTETAVINSFDAATTYNVTINGKSVGIAGDTDTATTATSLATALEASNIPEFAEIAWASNTSATLTATANTAGKPYTITLTASGGTGSVTDFAILLTGDQTNDGPNVWSADNFKTSGARGTLPGAADTVILKDSNVSLLYNLDQSAAGTMTDLQIFASYTGIIGLDKTNDDGTAYDEYRQRYLALDVGIIRIGDGDGSGSGKIRLQPEGTVSSFVSASEASSNDDFAAVEVFGNSQAVTIATVDSGSVDFARDNGVAGATIATMNVDNDAVVRVDSNSTLGTAVNVTGGELNVETAMVTLTIRDDGTVNHTAGNITTANVFGGVLNVQNDAILTITTANIGTGGTIDTTNSTAAVTLANTDRKSVV